MKNFDERREERRNRDRTFVIGGEQFTARAGVRPEDIAEWDTIDQETPQQTLAALDSFIARLVEDHDAEEKWARVRSSEHDGNPITIGDIRDVAEWLIGLATGRDPTPQDSPSSPGPEGNGTPSTGASFWAAAGA